jgi:hypothetical protein
MEAMSVDAKTKAALSRSGWTILQAALGVVSVEMFDLPVVYVPIIAAGLSQVKSYVATKVGDPSTVTFS